MLNQRKTLEITLIVRNMSGVVVKTPFELSNDTPLSLASLRQSPIKVMARPFKGRCWGMEIGKCSCRLDA